MKTNRYFILLTILLLAVAYGCSLDEYNPTAGPTMEDKASTVDGYEQLINACYFPLTRQWTGGAEDWVIYQAEAGTDLWVSAQGRDYMQHLFNYNDLNGASANLEEGWVSSYETINMCNAAIMYVEKPNYSSEQARNAKVAEAYYLRAFFNYFVVEYFGGKYLPTTFTTAPITEIPTSSVDEFYALIFSDLKFAMQNLPATQKQIGRATKAAAYHLYAKACLQYAAYDSAPNKTELYTEAKNAATEVINNRATYGLELYSESSQIFDVSNNKSNKEAVWVATHSSVPGLNPRGTSFWNRVYKQFNALRLNGSCGVDWDLKSEYVGGNARIMPTLALLDMYEDPEDTRYNAFFRETYYATSDYTWSAGDCNRYGKNVDDFAGKKTIAKGDLAMWFTRENVSDSKTRDYACFGRNDIYNADGTANALTILQGYTALKKFEAPGWYIGDLGNSYTYADQIIFRLSDTYLLAAEACYRLGGADLANAVTYINTVRNRACENHDGSMNIDQTDLDVDFILAERARELCGEYTRWIDLKRMGKDVMASYINSNPDIKAVGKFNIATHYVWPVPEGAEINYVTNPDELQNPGYQ